MQKNQYTLCRAFCRNAHRTRNESWYRKCKQEMFFNLEIRCRDQYFITGLQKILKESVYLHKYKKCPLQNYGDEINIW